MKWKPYLHLHFRIKGEICWSYFSITIEASPPQLAFAAKYLKRFPSNRARSKSCWLEQTLFHLSQLLRTPDSKSIVPCHWEEFLLVVWLKSQSILWDIPQKKKKSLILQLWIFQTKSFWPPDRQSYCFTTRPCQKKVRLQLQARVTPNVPRKTMARLFDGYSRKLTMLSFWLILKF